MKKLVGFATGMTFLPMLGLYIMSKIGDILEQYEGTDEFDQAAWTAAEWDKWWGAED